MNAIEKKKSQSFEKDPQALEIRLKEALQLVEKIPRYERFPKKYKAALEHVISQKLIMLFEVNPSTPLKEVIIHAITGLNDDLPDYLLLEMTQFALKKWKNLSAEALQKNSDIQLV